MKKALSLLFIILTGSVIAAQVDVAATTNRYRVGSAIKLDPTATIQDEDGAWTMTWSEMRNLANGNGASFTNINETNMVLQPFFAAGTAEPTIYDQDYNSDCGDVGGHALALGLHRAGYIKLLAVGICTSNSYAGAAARAVNQFYNHPEIPVGTNSTSTVTGSDTHMADIMATNWYGGLTALPNSSEVVALYRSKLAAAADNSVTLITGGQLKNVMDLMESPADGYSALSGTNLMNTKLKRIISIFGDYPTGAEYNATTDPVSAAKVSGLTNLTSVDIFWIGYTAGGKIKTGQNFYYGHSTDSPVRRAYVHVLNQIGSSPSLGRQFWDEAPLAFGAWTNFFSLVSTGFNSCDGGGNNTWTTNTAYRQYYLDVVGGYTNRMRDLIHNVSSAESFWGNASGTDLQSICLYNNAGQLVGMYGIDTTNVLVTGATNDMCFRTLKTGGKIYFGAAGGLPFLTLDESFATTIVPLKINYSTTPAVQYYKGTQFAGMMGIDNGNTIATGGVPYDMVFRTGTSSTNKQIFTDNGGNQRWWINNTICHSAVPLSTISEVRAASILATNQITCLGGAITNGNSVWFDRTNTAPPASLNKVWMATDTNAPTKVFIGNNGSWNEINLAKTFAFGTVANGETATMVANTNKYSATFSGATATIALPASPPDGTWVMYGVNTYTSGEQILTIPSLIRPEIGSEVSVTTITNAQVTSSGRFMLGFTALGGSFITVTAVGDKFQ